MRVVRIGVGVGRGESIGRTTNNKCEWRMFDIRAKGQNRNHYSGQCHG